MSGAEYCKCIFILPVTVFLTVLRYVEAVFCGFVDEVMSAYNGKAKAT